MPKTQEKAVTLFDIGLQLSRKSSKAIQVARYQINRLNIGTVHYLHHHEVVTPIKTTEKLMCRFGTPQRYEDSKQWTI